MKKFTKSRKGLVALLATLVLAISAVGAYAYFTANGTGTGSATVGTSSAILLSSTPVTNLLPNGEDHSVTVTIENPGSSDQLVGTVSGVVADNTGCLGAWFQVDSVPYNATLAAETSADVLTEVRMPVNTTTNQNACQGKQLTINWSSN